MLGKHRLNPNEQTELKVTYGTAGRPGLFEKKVTLGTNIPGQEKIEIFAIKGEVREAPSAKISVSPRKIVLEGSERLEGRKQSLSVKNEGTLPLVIVRIISKDGRMVFFDGAKEGNITIEPAATKEIEIRLSGREGEAPEREYIVVESNAKNAGESGYFLIVQYSAPAK